MSDFWKIAAVATITLCLIGPTQAANWYAGMDITYSKMSEKLTENLNDTSGGNLIIGNKLKPWLFLEAAIHAQQTQETLQILDSNYSTELNVDTRGISLGAKLVQPLSDNFTVYVKPSIAYTSTEIEFKENNGSISNKINDTNNQAHPIVGVGIEYMFSDKFSAEISYERQFDAIKIEDEKISLDSFNIGFRYHF